MTDRQQIRTRLSSRSRSFGAGLIALVLALGAGCSNNKATDDLARLTGERDALREAIARDRAALQNVPDEPIAAAPPENTPTYLQPVDDGDFGPGTTTRRDHGDLVVEVAGDVLFDSGSIVLKSSAKRTLDQVARRISNDYSGNTVRVEGHTDTDPIKKTKSKYQDNEELSAQRALAVERYLVSKGVASRRIYSAAFGPSKPKGTKKASRRVEIVILNVP
jgi:outer membrane protein OmpA-like peptidoglycan-associated protein